MRVTIQQAAANAFATWLATQMSDVVVEPRWPSPDKKKSAKSITLVTAGRRRDTPIDLRALNLVNQGLKQTKATWQIKACIQPMQLDVWALTDVDRDDILARLDDLLNADSTPLGGFNSSPVGIGTLVKLADGWTDCDTFADFVFEEPGLDETSDAVGRSLYRATFRGNAYFILTVTTVTARQLAINFPMRLSESDNFVGADFP